METRSPDAGLTAKTDEALKFLLYMVDVNVLFDVALGTYDFDLVMMVAEKSQKDPKEYLPFLNRLRAMEPGYCKYSIDRHLKRWGSALEHLVELPDHFPECLALVEEQRLHKQALALLAGGSDQYKQVCRSYATYLKSKRYHEEASYLLERAGYLGEACEAAAEALAWRRAGSLAVRAGWGPEQRAELGRGLVERLEGAGRGQEAAAILREWLGDGEEGVAVLARTQQWEEAVSRAREGGREDLLETHVRPALLERRQVLEVSVATRSKQLGELVARLEVVRRSRAGAMEEGGDEEDDRNLEDADLFSETTSVGGGASTVRTRSTLQTRATSRSKSSKTRRKADRRLYSTKEGSSHEDLGIMAEVHELVTGLVMLRLEVGLLLRGLAELMVEQGAAELQGAVQELLEQGEKCLPLVWPEERAETGDKFGPEATVEDIVRGGVREEGYR